MYKYTLYIYTVYISIYISVYICIYIYNMKVKVLAALSCLTVCNPMDCSPPGSSAHGILQAGKLEWVEIPFSRVLQHTGIEPGSPTLQADSLPSEPLGSRSVCI